MKTNEDVFAKVSVRVATTDWFGCGTDCPYKKISKMDNRRCYLAGKRENLNGYSFNTSGVRIDRRTDFCLEAVKRMGW